MFFDNKNPKLFLTSSSNTKNLASFLWGLAEATLFFFVPDILLSLLGRKSWKVGMFACLLAIFGASLGGIFMYYLGNVFPSTTIEILNTVPAIDYKLIASVKTALEQEGIWAILWAPLSGTPYKIYAGQAALQGISIWSFMLIGVTARGLRFLVVMTSVHLLCVFFTRIIVPSVPALKRLKSDKLDRLLIKLILLGWIIFYLFYFYYRMPLL